ncbi:restriction modification system DNA specificity domain protein [Lactobacillus acetotolerans]|uniref:Restriction modification system DNA specificity domain protein n=1 Tax=Lactobacillus acetotolerans TaxID=1600 RepID=A0A0D6A438_9LACO|nr:restriction endonuclease subunit S [Lactobacillus acetotolerans]BAQ57200.1 restriction modification system DNA specificity domain protein [Lactobacillus acetotolerans]
MSKRKTPILRFKGFNNAWEQRKLGDIAKIVGGGTPSTKNSQYWNGNINWYSPTEIGKNAFVNESKKKITKAGLQHSSAKLLPKNKTILFTSRANIGDLAIMTSDGATNQGFQSWVIDQLKIDIYFLYSLGNILKNQAIKLAYGSTFLEISNKNVKNLQLKIPNIQEQKKIGSLFKIIDELLTLQKRKTALTKRIYLGILQKLFSNYSLKKYKRYKLKDVSISKKGKEIKKNEIFKTGKYAVVHYADLYKFYPVQKNAIHFSNKKLGILIPNNSLLFPGSDVTPSGLARTSTILQKNVFAGNDVIIFCLNENKVSAQFLSYELNFLKEEILSLITGTTIKHIYIKDLENMDIFLPSMKVQKLIENVLNKITYKRISNKNIIFQLSKFKQFLLQNMFI